MVDLMVAYLEMRAVPAGASKPSPLPGFAVEQVVDLHHLVRLDQQRDENAALPGMSDVESLPVEPDLDVAE